MNDPAPRFTGIFIPMEILNLKDLTFFEMILLSWIDALYSSSHGGCFASNEYLGAQLNNAQPNTVAKAISKLRTMGLIEDVSFDGRQRVIRALINRYVEKSQSNAGLDKNPKQNPPIQPCIGFLSNSEFDGNPSGVPPSPYIYESKDENKDIARSNCSRPATQPRTSKISDISFSFDKYKFENITDEDFKTWQQLYPSVDVKREIMEMIEWIKENPQKAKSKKLWRKFIRTWLQRQNEKLTNRSAYQNAKEKQVLSRHTGFQRDNSPRDPRKVIDLSQDI